jgi:hypothetical protein
VLDQQAAILFPTLTVTASWGGTSSINTGRGWEFDHHLTVLIIGLAVNAAVTGFTGGGVVRTLIVPLLLLLLGV